MRFSISNLQERIRNKSAAWILRKAFQKAWRTVVVEFKALKSLVIKPQVSDGQFRKSLNEEMFLFEPASCFGRREAPRFFIDLNQKEDIVRETRSKYPEAFQNTIRDADKVCNHIFDLLGVGETALGEHIEWHRDFKSGWCWKKRFYLKIKKVYFDGSDVKVPWELSRFQHLPTLGKAYWYTGNEKYAREFVSELVDWIDENPVQYGVNWSCTMEVAIRICNWMWGYYFFKDSPAFTEEFHIRFLKSVLEHGRHIYDNLENKEDFTSNHYLADIVGLIFLGIMFPEFKEAKQWKEFGIAELVKEIEKQVYEDGVDFEASIPYHRLALELFVYPAILCKLNSIRLPQSFWNRLEKMFEFVLYYTKPDGKAPQIGDNDDGRFFILNNYADWNGRDHRYLLAIGGELFDRDDFRIAAGGEFEDAVWLMNTTLQPATKEKPSNTSSCQSRAFPDAGIYIMCKDDLYMIIDCGRNGQNGNGGHSHNDTLSFELYSYGESFIVDPGTYVYTSDPQWRNRFRSTAYHNTAVVDDQEQNEIDKYKLFSLRNQSDPKVNRWVNNDEYDFLDAEHYGYHRLKDLVTHRRQITFDKRQGYWIIKDMLIGKGKHKIDWYFHFDSGIELEVFEGLAVEAKDRSGASLLLRPLETKGLNFSIIDGWVSKSYGVKEQAPILRYSISASVPFSATYLLMPLEKGHPASRDKIEQVLEECFQR